MEDRDVRGYVAELLGTFVFVLLTACAVSANVRGALEPWMVVVVALTTGAGYAAALAFTLPHSNGFLNPAMPIALWVFRQLDGVRALGYILVQFVGALVAGGLVRALFSFPEWASRGNHLGTPHLVEDTLGGDPLGMRVKGIAIEFFLTYAVALTIFGTVVRRRSLGKSIQLSPLWIGLALAAATLASFPMTGAGLNPARWFGSAVWELTLINTNAFSDHVAFWVGPIGGSLAAAWSYNVFLKPADSSAAATGSEEA